MHWWTWMTMGLVMAVALIVLAVVARGTVSRLPAMRAAQAALQAKLQGDGALLQARADELIIGPLELLELRAQRTAGQIALLKGKSGRKAGGRH